jgi:tRNA (adenine-N(1)-)-methyltransferase non-catalytic subunit
MRQTLSDSKEIIGTIIANSKSFNEKTEYSQEKYIKKKEKKYFEFIQVRKPTLRLLTEIFYRQDPDKGLGLRMDSLSQLISYSGVNSMGNFLLYESGSSGLASAAFLNSMGDHGDARLVHLHPGNFPQMQAVYALNLTDHHMKRCSSVNIYSVLRQYYQDESDCAETNVSQVESENGKMDVEDESSRKRKHENGEAADDDERKPSKRPNLEEDDGGEVPSEVPISDENSSNPPTDREARKHKWQLDNDEAIRMFKEKFDSLTIVAKEDPFPIFKELLPFIHYGRPVVIFHTCKEMLMECYSSLRANNALVNVRLFTTFMRNYQVLPMRTHPAIQLQGTSGWMLVGYTVSHNIL